MAEQTSASAGEAAVGEAPGFYGGPAQPLAEQILETYKADGFLVCRVIDARGVRPWRFTRVSHK